MDRCLRLVFVEHRAGDEYDHAGGCYRGVERGVPVGVRVDLGSRTRLRRVFNPELGVKRRRALDHGARGRRRRSKYPNLKFVMAEYNADPNNPTDTELRQANDIVFKLPSHKGMGTFFWEPTRHVDDNNVGMFTAKSNVYTPVAASIGQYDQMKTAYGL